MRSSPGLLITCWSAMDDTHADQAQAQLRAGVYGRLSETYDAAESVPTQMVRGAGHARLRGWAVVATFKMTATRRLRNSSGTGSGS
jgi:poly(3-hydroxybutyrate) depolymerase